MLTLGLDGLGLGRRAVGRAVGLAASHGPKLREDELLAVSSHRLPQGVVVCRLLGEGLVEGGRVGRRRAGHKARGDYGDRQGRH